MTGEIARLKLKHKNQIGAPIQKVMTTEKHYRSIIKAVSWRLTGSVDTLVISFLITRQLKWAFTISGVELFTKVFLYYIHERIWNKIPLGRIQEPKDKPNFEI